MVITTYVTAFSVLALLVRHLALDGMFILFSTYAITIHSLYWLLAQYQDWRKRILNQEKNMENCTSDTLM